MDKEQVWVNGLKLRIGPEYQIRFFFRMLRKSEDVALFSFSLPGNGTIGARATCLQVRCTFKTPNIYGITVSYTTIMDHVVTADAIHRGLDL
jgi:hypothetical protein